METYNNITLLIVDLGTSVVLKNEGQECQLRIGGNTVDVERDDVRVWRSTFEELRRDLDALDGEKPVPRIERWSFEPGYYHLYYAADTFLNIVDSQYDALSELAGKPLPVWKGRKGEWANLIDDCSCNFQQAPVGIWRYTLKGEQK